MASSTSNHPGSGADGFEAAPIQPALEFVLEVRLRFNALPKIADMPVGGERGTVCVQSGEFSGPQLRGTVLPASGCDHAFFRPDGVVSLNARYLLQEEDGSLIMLQNQGFVWGRSEEVMRRFSRIANGQSTETVDPSEYYFRTMTTFETSRGKHDWLTRHVFVGSGARLRDGNLVRYYKAL